MGFDKDEGASALLVRTGEIEGVLWHSESDSESELESEELEGEEDDEEWMGATLLAT